MMQPHSIRTAGVGFVIAAAGLLAIAVFPAGADHGDPSTRPNPAAPTFSPDVPRAVGTLKQEGMDLTFTITPQVPQADELTRVALNIHDAEQDRDFQGDVKYVVTAPDGTEVATGSALTEDGDASFLILLPAGGVFKARFEYDVDIPAWSASRTKRPGPSTPPLAVGAESKGKVWCEIPVAGRAGEMPVPLPWAIGGGVALLLAAIVFLRRRG